MASNAKALRGTTVAQWLCKSMRTPRMIQDTRAKDTGAVVCSGVWVGL